MRRRRETPLLGRQLVVTRARGDGARLAQALRALGAAVAVCPAIEIVPPRDLGPLRRAIRDLASFDWIVFTSRHAVERFFRAIPRPRRGGRKLNLAGRKVAAVGPATRDALRARGVAVRFVPDRSDAESLGRALARRGRLEGRSVLLPRSAIAPPDLASGLRRAGAIVADVPAYTTRTPRPGRAAERMRRLVRKGRIDAFLLASGSAARGVLALLGRRGGAARGLKALAIGRSTAAEARRLGFTVLGVAREPSDEGLLAATVERLRGGGARSS